MTSPELEIILKKESYSYHPFSSTSDFKLIQSQLPKHLESNTSLRYLHISCPDDDPCLSFFQDLFQSLETNTTLESLSLKYDYFSSDALSTLNQVLTRSNTTLTSLDLTAHRTSLDIIKPLTPPLVFLTLADIVITNTSLTSLTYNDEYFHLLPMSSKERFLDVLCHSNTSLLSLQLPTSPFHFPSIIKLLKCNSTLQSFSFSYKQPTLPFIKKLHKLQNFSLTSLTLDGDPFTSSEIVSLLTAVNSSLPNLSFFSFRCTKPNSNTFIFPSEFFHLLSRNTTLIELYVFSSYTFVVDPIDVFCSFIQNISTLVSLTLPIHINNPKLTGFKVNQAYAQSPSLLNLTLSDTWTLLLDSAIQIKQHNLKMKNLTFFQSLLSQSRVYSQFPRKISSLSQ